ncbi:MAG: YgiQ family radical SAM protein [Spirochaetales bacterium]|nr:YgiQ family radical SAM protein [Spirochaetales bacterium]
MGFLPITTEEMTSLGWERADFIIITGDAYVDHPSFGTAVIARVLESQGFNVAIIAQPDWKDLNSFQIFGKPRYAFLINAGNMDSMVSNYTASRKPRSNDAYSPGGEAGHRPDRATIVYSAAIKQIYKKVPIIIGGIEASLRRLAHYDYWDNKIRRSILMDSKADLLVYGMGENQILTICERLKAGESLKKMHNIPGTSYRSQNLPEGDFTTLPSFLQVQSDKKEYAQSFSIQYRNTDPFTATRLVEPYSDQFVVQNPPTMPLNREQLDWVHELPYQRDFHPFYKEKGGIKAIEEVKFSLISSRGCYGACNFCALTFHQGRIVQSRSQESLIREAEMITKEADFKGFIHDVGGPTANFRAPACKRQLEKGVCTNRNCLAPEPCPNLEVDHSEYLQLLRKLRNIDKVKKVFIRSGIRFDYLMLDPDESFFNELVEHHISGQLKVAPEHVSESVLRLMGKPGNKVFSDFSLKYREINSQLGKNQFLVPYFISSHPGSTLCDAIKLAEYLRDSGLRSDQVQDFIPTPGTVSTVMFYSGYNPLTMEKVETESTPQDKAMQRALLQYRRPENRELVRKALIKAHRKDLIGNAKDSLIPNATSQTGRKRQEDKVFSQKKSNKNYQGRYKKR